MQTVQTGRLILEISGPRLGSTNFRKVMERFGTVEALGEFFNPTFDLPAPLLARFSEAAAEDGHEVAPDRQSLTRFALADPVRAVNVAMAACARAGRTHPVLKLAPGHLSAPQISRIIAWFRPFGIVLHRNPVDQFISREKALALRAWTSVDTTAVKPSVSARTFRAWHWRQQNHLQMGRLLLQRQGCPCLVLAYEEIYAEADNMAVLLQERFRQAGLDLGQPAGEGEVLNRQDRSRDVREKIANWDDFAAEIARIDPSGRLQRYEIEGNPPLLRAQYAAESLLPRTALRRLAGRLGISGMPDRARSVSG